MIMVYFFLILFVFCYIILKRIGGLIMNQKGFIASALLYGMLALFLVIMLSTLYVMANNKITMDKLKEKALDVVENG